MSVTRKYIAVFVALVVTSASIGAPVVVYRCMMSGKYVTPATICCKVAQPCATQHGNIRIAPCFQITELGLPLKTNAVAQVHTVPGAHFAFFALVPQHFTVNNSLLSVLSNGGHDGACLSPPPLLSTVLLI